MVASPFVGVRAMAKRVRGPAPRKVVHFMTAPSRSCIASDAAVQRRPCGSAGRSKTHREVSRINTELENEDPAVVGRLRGEDGERQAAECPGQWGRTPEGWPHLKSNAGGLRWFVCVLRVGPMFVCFEN
jgi:hypothetical protein